MVPCLFKGCCSTYLSRAGFSTVMVWLSYPASSLAKSIECFTVVIFEINPRTNESPYSIWQKIFGSRCIFSENFWKIIQNRDSLDETEQDSGESPSVRTRPLTERFCITGREEKIPFADDGDIQPFVSTRFVFVY